MSFSAINKTDFTKFYIYRNYHEQLLSNISQTNSRQSDRNRHSERKSSGFGSTTTKSKQSHERIKYILTE